jgi:hypothetical protein
LGFWSCLTPQPSSVPAVDPLAVSNSPPLRHSELIFWIAAPPRNPNLRIPPTSKRILPALAVYAASSQAATVLEGKTAFSDYTQQKPGVMHKITPADLPAPYPTQSVDNGPKLVPARKARCRKR